MLRPAVVVTVTVVPVVAVAAVLVLVLVAVDTKSTVIQLFATKSSRIANHMFLPVRGARTVSSHCLCHGMRRPSVLREQGLVQCVRRGPAAV